MIISPPFLPAPIANDTEALWLQRAMVQPTARAPGSKAFEGSFPVSAHMQWHTGIHWVAPYESGAPLPVRAIADGLVVFASPPTPQALHKSDAGHPQNYNPGISPSLWSDNGCVIVRHETDIGAAGAVPTRIVYFSLYMHLGTLGDAGHAGHATPAKPAPWKTGDRIYRKDVIGTAGKVYDAGGNLHFEVCCDTVNLKAILGRAPAWVDVEPKPLVAPSANGRSDALFGSVFIYLPTTTPMRAKSPGSELGLAGTALPAGAQALNAVLWIEIRYDQGAAHVSSYDALGALVGTLPVAKGFEYDLYKNALDRHAGYLAAKGTLASSPSGWYELLRFGRKLGPDPLPTDGAHWREIPTAQGNVWADLNAPGTFKFSEADFLPVMGWNCYDDDPSPLDQRCDSVELKRRIRDPDPANQQIMKREQLGARLGRDDVQKKLRRAICNFPTEWDRSTIQARHTWLRDPKEGFGLEDEGHWGRFVRHCEAMTFVDLPEEYKKATWRFHPGEFIEGMRRCGWLSLQESIRSLPNAKVSDVSRFYFDLNKLARKYLGPSMHRRSHFLGQIAHESRQLAKSLAETGQTKGSRDYESAGTYFKGPDGYFNQYEYKKILGHVSVGDGIKFRGRGAIQLTGLYNYTQYWLYRGWISKSSFDDPWWDKPGRRIPGIGDPQRISAREGTDQYDTMDSSLSYWAMRSINRQADKGVNSAVVLQVTYLINAGGFHRAQREKETYLTFDNLGDSW